MYKSPIEKIYGELETQMVREDENMVIKAVRKVGVNVDKDELISALRYDRHQYTKGYEDGKNEVLEKVRAEINDLADYDVPQAFNKGLRKAVEIIDKYRAESADNIFLKMTDEERTLAWMNMIFNRKQIIEKTEQWTKEAKKRGMTLTEYLESINPLDTNNGGLPSWLGKNCKDCGNEKCKS